MRYVALLTYGPNWKTGRPIERQGEAIGQHLLAMQRLYDEGILLLGGPFEHHGGIAVLEATDEATAAAVMAADPAVIAGVLDYELQHLVTYFDAYVGTRASVPGTSAA